MKTRVVPSEEIAEKGSLRASDYIPEKLEDRMLRWFEFKHLPAHLQAVSMVFSHLAKELVSNIEPGPERTVALRKLLESKDAAVRAKLHPGG